MTDIGTEVANDELLMIRIGQAGKQTREANGFVLWLAGRYGKATHHELFGRGYLLSLWRGKEYIITSFRLPPQYINCRCGA